VPVPLFPCPRTLALDALVGNPQVAEAGQAQRADDWGVELKRFAFFVLLFVVAFVGTWIYLSWRGHSGVSSPAPIAASEIERARSKTAVRLAAVEKAARESTIAELPISEQELRDLVLVWLADQAGGAKILARTREVRVAIGENELEVGLEVLLDDRSLEKLEGDEREGIERLLQRLPLLLGQELYLAVRGAPVAKSGSLAVAGTPEIQLGALTLSLRAVAEQIGVSAARLKEGLLLEIEGYSVEEVRVEDHSLVLTVTSG
jgi:hypothetical protein